MNLKQLIYKRLVHAKDIGGLLAKYAGHPAVFDTEAPDDKQDGWEGKTQYPRLDIVLDMQANEETFKRRLINYHHLYGTHVYGHFRD